MKRIGILAIVMFMLALSMSSQAQYKMAAGVRFSNDEAVVSNSISFKYFFNDATAVEGLFSFSDPGALGVLIEQHKKLLSKNFRWFYGGGGYVGFGEGKIVGLQGVIGIDYKLPLIPLNLSIDWKPEINLARVFIVEPEAIGLSARFTFK